VSNNRFKPLQRWLILFGCAGGVLFIDQAAKAWVVSNIPLGMSSFPIPALSDYFALTTSQNRGAAFSLLPQAADIFLIIAIVMLFVIPYFYRRLPDGHLAERIALGMLLGGVAGNALDRLRLGYVVDFVHLQFRPFISNVSNLADHAIVLSIAILFIVGMFEKRPVPQPPPAADPVDSSSQNEG
jgi:signal peptidase II